MSNHKNVEFRILKERKIEKQLKNYFKLMDISYGEDFASQILSSSKSPRESLQMFTSKFPEISDTDIILALIKASVITRDDNYAILFIRDMIQEGNMEDVMNIVYSNLRLRKMLTRTFIHDCYADNYQSYGKSSDDNCLGDLITIYYFQNSINLKKVKK